MILKKEIKTIDNVNIHNILYDSSNVLKTSYNYNTNRLVVSFKKGTVYTYFNVPHKIYEKIVSEESIGKALNRNLKGLLFEMKGNCGEDLLNSMLSEITILKETKEI